MENGAANGRFYFEDFKVDALKRVLLKKNAPVSLNPKAFDLLVALVEHPGETMSKQTLLDLVWTDQFVEEKNLTVQVAALRKALGEGKNEHRFIATLPGYGYKFVADLKSPVNGQNVTEDGSRVDVVKALEPQRSRLSRLSHAPFALSLGAIILMLGLIVGGYVWLNRRNAASAGTASTKNISIRRLTSDGLVTNCSLSPDGKLFAYSHLDGEDQSLWLGHVDGGDPIEIRPPAPIVYLDFKFTPDASSLYYTLTDEARNVGGVYKIPVFGGPPEKIKDKPYSIAISPDGKQFAFVRGDPKYAKPVLVISDADGKNEREVAASPDMMNFVDRAGAWSPDGSTLAIGALRSDTNTGFEIYTVNMTDGSTKPLTNAAWNRVGALAWLADGSGLVMVGQKVGSTQSQLWSVSFPTGEIKHLVSDLNLYGSTIGLGKDQNTMLSIQAQAQSNIWVAPVDDLARAKQITFGSIGRRDGWFGVKWTSDGRIVYTATAGEINTIWTMNAGGGDQKQLIPSEGDSIYPSFSADNKFVVFQSNRRGNYAVWRANLDGSDIRQLTRGGIAAQPDISPDGHWIVYISSPENSGELWRATSSGDDAVKLTEGASWPRISPDSRSIACGYIVDGKTKVAIFSIDGGNPLITFDLPPHANIRSGVHWTPDGAAISYRDWVNGIWRQDLAGGSPQRLKGLPTEKLYAYEWSEDGKYLAFTRGIEIRDVVLISDFR